MVIFRSHRRALQTALSQRAGAAGGAGGAAVEGKFTFFAITWIRFIDKIWHGYTT